MKALIWFAGWCNPADAMRTRLALYVAPGDSQLAAGRQELPQLQHQTANSASITKRISTYIDAANLRPCDVPPGQCPSALVSGGPACGLGFGLLTPCWESASLIIPPSRAALLASPLHGGEYTYRFQKAHVEAVLAGDTLRCGAALGLWAAETSSRRPSSTVSSCPERAPG